MHRQLLLAVLAVLEHRQLYLVLLLDILAAAAGAAQQPVVRQLAVAVLAVALVAQELRGQLIRAVVVVALRQVLLAVTAAQA